MVRQVTLTRTTYQYYKSRDRHKCKNCGVDLIIYIWKPKQLSQTGDHKRRLYCPTCAKKLNMV